MCVLTGYLCSCVLCMNCLVFPGVSLRCEAGSALWLTGVFAGVSELRRDVEGACGNVELCRCVNRSVGAVYMCGHEC